MKRYLVVILLIFAPVTFSFSQRLASVNKPGIILNPEPGYIMINEFNSGIGLGVTSDLYSRYFVGFTTIHGYQINKYFLIAGGTGFSVYNGGSLIPVFLDFRYRIFISRWTPYVFIDGGMLIDFSSKKESRLFMNPGFGCSYTASRSLAFNIGVGMFSQFEDTRASYYNLKTGVTWKF